MTRTPSFSLPAFEFALFPSQPDLPLPLLSPSIRPSSLLFALKNRAMPSAKVSRFTSPNNRSGVPVPRRPPAAGAHRAPCSGCPAPGLAAWAQLHRAGRGAAVRAPGDTRALVPALGRFPVHAGKSPPASVFALAPASAAWIALLFLSGLQLAADPGERGAGRTAGGGGWGWREVGHGSGRKKKKKVWQGGEVGRGGGRGRRAPVARVSAPSGPARVCLRVSVCCARRGQCVASGGAGRRREPGEDQARFGGRGWWGWRVRVAVSVSVSVRARAAENQEVTAAKRTQTCLIAVT